MFQFSGFPPYSYLFTVQLYAVNVQGFPIRTPADQGSFAAPRSFSQLIASFVGFRRLGIPLMLFVA